MSDHIYNPLRTGTKQIRLLTLQSGAEMATQITGTIDDADLEHQPKYDAISWVWGNPPFTGSMILNGALFPIPQHLEDALKHFRLSGQPRMLWADAVCINQNDAPEKEAQIKLMGDIYRTANSTLVWLGLMESHMDQVTFERLNKLGCGISLRQLILEEAKVEAPHEGYSNDQLDRQLEGLDPEGGQYQDPDFLVQIHNFFALEWWDRLWVLQEVALASEVQLFWGSKYMDFDTLTSACDIMLTELRDRQTILGPILGAGNIQDFIDLLAQTMDPTRQLMRIYNLIHRTETAMSHRDMCFLMIEVLAKGRSRNTSILHDKVYGLLGLVPAELVQSFQPSYTKTAKQVFCDTANQILDLSKSFMVFNCIREGEKNRPSWCPDWNYRYHQFQDFHLRAQQEPLFQACDTAPWRLDRHLDSVLGVNGFRLDVLQRECSPTSDLLDAAGLYIFLEKCLNLLSASSDQIQNTRYITDIGILEAVSRIALNDCEQKEKNGPIQRLSDNNCRRFKDWLSTVDKDFKLTEYDRETSDASEAITFEESDNLSMCEFVRSVIRGKSFFTTKLGYAGLTDDDSRTPLDEVWILDGGSQPVVLRPEPGENGSYYVCSEAYVHGVMHGEAARGEVPTLPQDGNSQPVISHRQNGGNSWPQPEHRAIRLL